MDSKEINAPARDPSDYYKRSITITFLDHLLCQLEEKFGDDQQHVCPGQNFVPSIVKDSSSRWKENAIDIATIYPMADILTLN